EWAAATARLDNVRVLVEEIRKLIDAGALRQADRRVTIDLIPAVLSADEKLEKLIRVNHDAGRTITAEADAAWARTRRLSILLDGLCVVVTGALAFVALRTLRRYELLTKRRTDELEAFAARVAHDVRGPLMPALLALQSIASRPNSEAE